MVYNQERSAEETAWGYHVFPVTIFQENKNRWVVAAEDGHQQFLMEDTFPPCRYGSEDLPSCQTTVEGETGTFRVSLQLIYTIQPETASGGNGSFFESINAGGTTFLPPDCNAEFSSAFYYQTFQWTAKDQNAVSASCSKIRMNVSFPDTYTADYEAAGNPGAPAWNGTLLTGGGSSFGGTMTEPELPPSADFRITIFLTTFSRKASPCTERRGCRKTKTYVHNLSFIAWAYVFLFIDFSLSVNDFSINVLPGWVGTLVTGSVFDVPLLTLILSSLSMYFHFQFLTNLSSIARAHGLLEDSEKLLHLRTGLTLFTALVTILYFLNLLELFQGVFLGLFLLGALLCTSWAIWTVFHYRNAEKALLPAEEA